MSENMALVAGTNSKIQSLLILENEAGNSNKPPKLTSLDEYPHWKTRFEIYCNGTDTNLWVAIESGYVRPAGADGAPLSLHEMMDAQRTAYNAEKKAYALLTQSIPKDIFHQFWNNKTSKTLWDALEARYEGNNALKGMKSKALKKEFDNFSCLERESLDDILTRFYHLMSEMHAHGVRTTMIEKVESLADGLPAKWESYLTVLKENGSLEEMDINDFAQKLREKELANKYKAKRGSVDQNPSLYGSNTVPGFSSHASEPIQTAFISNSSNVSSSTQNTGSSGSFSQQNQSTEHKNTPLKTENFDKITVDVAKDHMTLLSALVVSYDGLVAGRIGNYNLADEDYAQVDEIEMERMDIMWALASAVRRAKKFVTKTGQELIAERETKYGFDKSKVTCYNCSEKGHFARECPNPKKTGNHNPFNSSARQNQSTKFFKGYDKSNITVNQSSSPKPADTSEDKKACTAHGDEGLNWSLRFTSQSDDEKEVNMVHIAEITEEVASESDSGSDEASSDNESSESVLDETLMESSTADTETNSTETSTFSYSFVNTIIDKSCETVNTNTNPSLDVDRAEKKTDRETSHFAFMTNTSEGPKVSSSANSTCEMCEVIKAKHQSNMEVLQSNLSDLKAEKSELAERNNKLINHNGELVVELRKCSDANKILKQNEQHYKERLPVYQKQLKETEIVVLNQAKDIEFYLKKIENSQKDVALLNVEIETLKNKLHSWSVSSTIVKNMVANRQGKDGIGYGPPLDGILNAKCKSRNDNPLKDHEIKVQLVDDPEKIQKPAEPVKDEVASSSGSKVDGGDSGLDEDKNPSPGLGSKEAESHAKIRNEYLKNDPNSLHIQKNKTLKNVFVKEGVQPSTRKIKILESNHNVQHKRSPQYIEQRSCFKCGKKGHFVFNCPYTQEYKKRMNQSPNKRPVHSKQRSDSPLQHQRPTANVKCKVVVSEMSKPSGSKPQPTKVNQSTVYLKRSLHNTGKWQVKSKDTPSKDNEPPTDSSSQSKGQWVEFVINDVDGKPKTVKAWVPKLN